VIAEAEGLFIAVDSGKFAALAAARAERGGQGIPLTNVVDRQQLED
jgi:hypothetical protein